MAFSYSGDPASSPRDYVRFLIADVNASAPLFQDAEVDAVLATASTPDWAAIDLIDAAIARYSFTPDRVIDGLSVKWGVVVDSLVKLRDRLSARAAANSLSGAGAFYAGGLSQVETQQDREDTDLRRPKFERDQFENLRNPPGGGPTDPSRELP